MSASSEGHRYAYGAVAVANDKLIGSSKHATAEEYEIATILKNEFFYPEDDLYYRDSHRPIHILPFLFTLFIAVLIAIIVVGSRYYGA